MSKALYKAKPADILKSNWKIYLGILAKPEGLVELFRRVYPERGWTPDCLKEIFSNPHISATWIARAYTTGRIHGHLSLKVEEGKPQGHWLAVDPTWRGLGIARALMHEAAKWCAIRSYSTLWSWSTTVNSDVHRFFLDANFEECPPDEAEDYQRTLHRLYSSRFDTTRLKSELAPDEALWPGEGSVVDNPHKFGSDVY